MDKLDPTCHAPASEIPHFEWSRDPEMLAMEISASVIRRMDRKHYALLSAAASEVRISLRDALDTEIRAAFRKLGLWADPSPDRASES